MREKSSSVLTSRNSLDPLRLTKSVALWRLGKGELASCKQILERPQHQIPGMRNSLLTLVKNAVFALSISAKASARFFSAE